MSHSSLILEHQVWRNTIVWTIVYTIFIVRSIPCTVLQFKMCSPDAYSQGRTGITANEAVALAMRRERSAS